MTPYYQDDTVTLYHGDCREVLPALDLEGVQTAIVDPPYGETALEWDRWVDGWPSLLAQYIPERTSMWCFGSFRMFLVNGCQFSDWRFAQDIVWEKHNGSGFQADRFKRVHELVTHWYRGPWGEVVNNQVFTYDARKGSASRTSARHMGEIRNGMWRSEDGGPRLMRSVQYVHTAHGAAVHPTQKPEGIVLPLIEAGSNPGGVILDPFSGSGTTALAARTLGRQSILIEVNERYCEAALARLAQGALDFGSS